MLPALATSQTRSRTHWTEAPKMWTIIVDPSHATGKRPFVGALANAGECDLGGIVAGSLEPPRDRPPVQAAIPPTVDQYILCPLAHLCPIQQQ